MVNHNSKGSNEKVKLKLREEVFSSLIEVNDVLKERFHSLKDEGKITMSYIVKVTEVNEAHLYQWLRGDYQLSRWVTIKKIASVLGIKIVIKK